MSRYALLLIAVSFTASSAPIPPEAIVQGVRVQDVSISPDGRYLAIVARQNGTAFVMVKDRRSADPPKTVYEPTHRLKYLPSRCHWAKLTRLVCTLTLFTPLGASDRALDLKLIAIDPDGGHPLVLLGDDGRWPQFPRVVDWQRRNPDEILISNTLLSPVSPFEGFNSTTGGLSRLDVRSNRMSTVGATLLRGNYRKFASDGRGEAILATGMEPGVNPDGWAAIARVSSAAPWIRLARLAPHLNDLRFEPVAIANGGTDAFMLMDRDGRAALWRIDLTDSRDPTLEIGHDEFNIHDVLRDGEGGLMGVRLATTAAGPIYLHPRARDIDASLRARWPALRNDFIDATSGLGEVVVRTWGAASVPTFRVFSGGATDPRLELIGFSAPELVSRTLAPTRSIMVPAGGGRRLYADLTLPESAARQKPPLVVLVSDWDEDNLEFDPLAQLLASNGYAVLRTHAAGSAADESWELAPLVDWSGQVFDDLAKVVRSIAEEDKVDATRLCLVGAGYGGFVALLGAVREDLHPACVIGINAVTDVQGALERTKSRAAFKVVQSNRSGGRASADARPIRDQASSAHAAILLIHNTLTKEAKAVASALVRAKKDNKVIVSDWAGDAFTTQVNREVTAFLAKHVPANAH